MKNQRSSLTFGLCAAICTVLGCAHQTPYNPYQGYPQYQSYPYGAQAPQAGMPIQPSPTVGAPTNMQPGMPAQPGATMPVYPQQQNPYPPNMQPGYPVGAQYGNPYAQPQRGWFGY